MPMLIARVSAQLVDQLTCPRFPLLVQILTHPSLSNRWFSRKKYSLLPAHHCAHLPYFSPPNFLVNFLFSSPIQRGEKAIYTSTSVLVSAVVHAYTISIYFRKWISWETTSHVHVQYLSWPCCLHFERTLIKCGWLDNTRCENNRPASHFSC